MKDFTPAFPQQPIYDNRGRGLEWADGWGYGGMTLRDWFAGLAMQGQLACGDIADASPEGVAKYAVAYADALIAELAKECI